MHTCPDCYSVCHCQGDIDDVDWGEWDGCEHYLVPDCTMYDWAGDERDEDDDPEDCEAESE